MKKYLFLSIYIVFSGCSVNPVTGKQDFVMMSENQEIAMGKRYHSQVLQQMPPYQDAELQAYVQRIGDSLSTKSHRPNLFYRFTVLREGWFFKDIVYAAYFKRIMAAKMPTTTKHIVTETPMIKPLLLDFFDLRNA